MPEPPRRDPPDATLAPSAPAPAEAAAPKTQATHSAIENTLAAGASASAPHPDAATGLIQTGKQIGPYQLLEKLGEGGMGAVFKARHTRLNKLVAIKVLPAHLTRDPAALARFDREMKAVGALEHPNIVRAMDANEQDGIHYLAMEYVEGQDLAQLVKKRGPLSVLNAAKIVRQAAQALAHAHAHGLVHRDIKPSNLFVSKQGQVKILDLGLARLGQEESDGLTSTGVSLGTPDYMAPEQWADTHSADARCDLYALGCTLFFLLTGRAPYADDKHKTVVSKLTGHVNEPPPTLASVRTEVPAELDQLYQKLLAKKVEERLGSAAELAKLLEPFTKPAPASGPAAPSEVSNTANSLAIKASAAAVPLPTPAKTSPTTKRHSPALLVGAALAAAVIACFGIWIIIRDKDGREIARIKVPEGGKAEIVTDADGKPIQTTSQGWHGWPIDAPKPAIAPFDASQAKKHQEEWAAYLKVPVEYENSIGMKFRLIPPGEFLMGASAEEIATVQKAVRDEAWFQAGVASEGPQHRVVLTTPYYLAVTEVSQGDYAQIMGKDPSAFAPQGAQAKAVVDAEHMRLPVDSVRFTDVVEFCNQLSAKEKLFLANAEAKETANEGIGYRLPTEAQWEFACRAGTLTRYWTGDQVESLKGNLNSPPTRPEAVSAGKANPFGLVNMLGNVWEFVLDRWELGYYGQLAGSPAINPTGPDTGTIRVIRGGFWGAEPNHLRSAARLSIDETRTQDTLGFRLALSIEAVRLNQSQSSPQGSRSWHAWPADAPKPAIAPFDAAQAKKHQEEWAAYLKVPVEYENSIGMKFRLIPPGEFVMGMTTDQLVESLPFSFGNEVWEKNIKSATPQHPVILTRPLYVGIHEVTQRQYERMMEQNPSDFSAKGAEQQAVAGLDTSAHPVEKVTWFEAAEFCMRLSKQEEFQPAYAGVGEKIAARQDGNGYRLPTEAEWEWFCQAGSTTKYWFGESNDELAQVGWHLDNSKDKTHTVGELKANSFGLFDVHGNVWEYVQDFWGPSYYQQFLTAPAVDPTGPVAGEERQGRGGGFLNQAPVCIASHRAATPADTRRNDVGFRVAVSVDAVRQALKVTGPALSKSVAAPPEASVSAAIDVASEREAAAWVLSNNGSVSIEMAGDAVPDWVTLKKGDSLPSNRFIVRVIELRDGQLKTDEDLARLVRCRYLDDLNLHSASGGDKAIQLLTRLPRLKQLGLPYHRTLRTSALRGLYPIPTLERLNITPEMVDDGLEFVRHFPALRTLNIYGPQPPDISLLAESPQLQTILLTTPDPVDAEKLATAQTRHSRLRIVVGWKGQYRTVGRDPAHEAAKHLVRLGCEIYGGVNYWQAPSKLLTQGDFEDGSVWSFDLRKVPSTVQLSAEDREKLKLLSSLHFTAEGQREADELAKVLSHNPGLASVTLTDCDLTDVGLAHLQKLVGLRAVRLTRTKVTQAAVDRLHQAAPGLGITFDSQVLNPDYRVSEGKNLKAEGGSWHGWPADAPKPAIAPFDAAQAKKHQDEWAAYLKVPVEYEDSRGVRFRLIPPGEFLMGSPASEPLAKGNERPQHPVALTQPFYLGVNEYTREHFAKFVTATKYATDAESSKLGGVTLDMTTGKSRRDPSIIWRTPGFPQKDQHPAVNISWNDARQVCSWLGEEHYRLPTEAEWEFAARAGTTTRHPLGDDPNELVKIGNVQDATFKDVLGSGKLEVNVRDGFVFSAPVGSYLPNPFGLNDMFGNVWEWCEDQGVRTYGESPAVNPLERRTVDERVGRGGAADCWDTHCRASYRNLAPKNHVSANQGFRLVLSVEFVKQAINNASARSSHGWPADAPKPAIVPFDAAQATQHQKDWAAYLKVPVEYTDGLGFKFRLVPPGEFLLGSSAAEIQNALAIAERVKTDPGYLDRIRIGEQPQRRVVIVKPFWLGETEVTLSQFKRFVAATKHVTQAEAAAEQDQKKLATYLAPGYTVSDKHPAAALSWNDAQALCDWCSAQEKVAYRLPTEAEWEFACRAGTRSQYSFGDDESRLSEFGWVSAGYAQPVAGKKANPWGFFDMHGNVGEWCHDPVPKDWLQTYQARQGTHDVPSHAESIYRIMRGGSAYTDAANARSASRFGVAPFHTGAGDGIRLVREIRGTAMEDHRSAE